MKRTKFHVSTDWHKRRISRSISKRDKVLPSSQTHPIVKVIYITNRKGRENLIANLVFNKESNGDILLLINLKTIF